MSRTRVIIASATVVLIAVAATAFAVGRGEGTSAAGTTAAHDGAATARVMTKDLAETKDVQGTLGYGATRSVSFAGHGTITALASVGSIVGRGGRLGEMNGAPVTLFFGDRPAWRDLQEGAPDGADIEQLEANLIALGFGTRRRLGPNRQWNNETTDAVKRWQHQLGVPETGMVTVGDVVYQPGSVRIASRGDSSASGGGAALQVTDTARMVTIDLDAQYQSLVKKDQIVQVELPSGATTPAKITSIGTVAVASQQGQNPTVPVVAALTDQTAGGNLDASPVTVHIATTQASGVMAVPVGALLALSEGGYAVEKVIGTGSTTLIGVHLGVFADGWVQVTGDVKAGDVVVVAQ